MNFDQLIYRLRDITQNFLLPMSVDIAQQYPDNQFPVLVSCLLSLQAQDKVTQPIAEKLCNTADSPEKMLALPLQELKSIISSINYYKNKAKTLHHVSSMLISEFDGKVPSSKQDLLSIKGIGLKTANLVLAEGFNIPAICVDTHVHRISNAWGIVHTKTPDQTEAALQKVLPKKYWIEWNRLLVMLGQNLCKKRAICMQGCPLEELCLQHLKRL